MWGFSSCLRARSPFHFLLKPLSLDLLMFCRLLRLFSQELKVDRSIGFFAENLSELIDIIYLLLVFFSLTCLVSSRPLNDLQCLNEDVYQMLTFIELVEFLMYGNMNCIFKIFFSLWKELKQFPSNGNNSRKTLALHLGHHTL